MICLSLGNMDFDALMEHLKYAPMAELRMDLLHLPAERYAALFAQHRNLIATCRLRDVERAYAMYTMAIDMGAAYIDVDMGHPAADALIAQAQRWGCGVVLSYHNFEHTPPLTELRALLGQMQQRGASVAKLACMATRLVHCHDMLALYDAPLPISLVAFCMGSMGRYTRVLSVRLGAPFAYACVDGQPTAPGQPTYDELVRLLRSA